MKKEIAVPRMGESINEATIGTLIKKSGSQVKIDEEILELETDKVNQVLYAPQQGLLTLTVSPGDVVKIGQVIGYVDSSAKGSAESPKPTVSVQEAVEPAPPPAPKPQPAPQRQEAPPTGEERRVRHDKEAFIADLSAPTAPVSAPTPPRESAPPKKTGERETRTKMTKIRKVIASRLLEAQHTTAMLTTFNEVDMSQVMQIREKYKESFLKGHGVKLGFMSFFVKAAVSALEKFPAFNSYIDGEDLVHREYYDMGIAVGTERGLVVPVIRDCDGLSYAGVEQEIEKYAKKAREGKLSVDDLQGGGFTITNGGVYGSLLSTPILNLPQCGILGMHKIEKRAVVVNDAVVIRPMMYLALSYDHRIVDGKEAVSFLVHIKECLEDPTRLLFF
jgi:2-oxoglutarate dehydrogenase E2 component (dihydrolipoamide succinyltransferase)